MAELALRIGDGHLVWPEHGLLFADHSYVYSVTGAAGGGNALTTGLAERTVHEDGAAGRVTGRFAGLPLEIEQQFASVDGGLVEAITLRNCGDAPIALMDVAIGFACGLARREAWRLCAVPFRVQLDGSRHDWSGADLAAGRFTNAVYRDRTRVEPDLIEADRLRSEAWFWWDGRRGLLVAKYNPHQIEMSVAGLSNAGDDPVLRFGGVGMCLYGEPSGARRLDPGQAVAFGHSFYFPVEGPLPNAFYQYRQLLEERGHSHPVDYDPPLNWNVLYDIGWHHSRPEPLKAHYTREALLREAAKARECQCQLLYLDPGWEVAEGTTQWDESRLGSLETLGEQLRDEFGLAFGFRTILRGNSVPPERAWPQAYLVRHATGTRKLDWHKLVEIDELCLCDDRFRAEKVERIDRICKVGGMRFVMVDEMDWRGPCYDPDHGHAVPTTALDHIEAVYDLCRELRRRNPELLIECHDPVWPWHTCIYVPTYFGQGFEGGAYQENWGFEYMWDCINDLRTGKALALYYYNLACSIPLYLHITMASDNDHAIFFWWAASTVRHLGIGGKYNHPSLNPKHMDAFDPEARFALYKRQSALYRALKPWFVRGAFHGIAEHIHLHTLPGRAGGVLNVFNLGDDERVFQVELTPEQLQTSAPPTVEGADASFVDGRLRLEMRIPAMAPAVVRLGDAVADAT